jgi:hypothetical protein
LISLLVLLEIEWVSRSRYGLSKTEILAAFSGRTVIESFNHKGLRNLFEQDDARKVKADQVDR